MRADVWVSMSVSSLLVFELSPKAFSLPLGCHYLLIPNYSSQLEYQWITITLNHVFIWINLLSVILSLFCQIINPWQSHPFGNNYSPIYESQYVTRCFNKLVTTCSCNHRRELQCTKLVFHTLIVSRTSPISDSHLTFERSPSKKLCPT